MRKSWIPGQEGGLLIGQLPQQTLANTSQPELFKTESKYTTWVSYHKIVTIVRQTITRTLKTYLLVDIYWSTECLLSMSPCMYVNLQVSKYMHSPVWVTQSVDHLICKQGLTYDHPNGLTYLQLGRNLINLFLFKYMAF